ncbi:MAG: PAS domain S-box protein, partial [Desulfomonilia bacterium]
MKISDIGGEFALIRRLTGVPYNDPAVIKGIGDDCAVLEYTVDKYLLITVDMMVENDHFSLAWHTPYQVGKKLMESNVSDIISMGGTPRWAFISLALRADTKVEFMDDFYRGLYDSLRNGVVRTNMEGNILECNQAYLNMLGYSRKEIKELTYLKLTPAKWHDKDTAIVQSQIMVRGYSDEYEKEYIRKDGTIFPISLRTWLIKDSENNSVGMWAIVRDITEQKRAEEEIRKLNGNLRQRTVEVEAINRELESFSYSVSHDLQSPLRSIDGFSQALFEDCFQKL